MPFVSIDGILCRVVEIMGEAFSKCKNVTEIILPDTITTIRKYAFAYLTIEMFVIPSSVTYVESFIISDFAPKQIIFCGKKEPTINESPCFSSLFHGKVFVSNDFEPEKTEAFGKQIIRKPNICKFVPIWQLHTCNNIRQRKYINYIFFIVLLELC